MHAIKSMHRRERKEVRQKDRQTEREREREIVAPRVRNRAKVVLQIAREETVTMEEQTLLSHLFLVGKQVIPSCLVLFGKR